MKLKDKIVTTAMCIAPVLSGGCKYFSQEHIIDSKSNNRVIIHDIKSPAIYHVIVFPHSTDEMDFYRYINVGDTLETRHLNKRDVYITNCSHSYDMNTGATEKSVIKRVNGKTIEQLQAQANQRTR